MYLFVCALCGRDAAKISFTGPAAAGFRYIYGYIYRNIYNLFIHCIYIIEKVDCGVPAARPFWKTRATSFRGSNLYFFACPRIVQFEG